MLAIPREVPKRGTATLAPADQSRPVELHHAEPKCDADHVQKAICRDDSDAKRTLTSSPRCRHKPGRPATV